MSKVDLTFVPKTSENYYVPCTSNPDFVVSYYVDPYASIEEKLDNDFHIENNLCYVYTDEGYEAAAKHGKAMLRFNLLLKELVSPDKKESI